MLRIRETALANAPGASGKTSALRPAIVPEAAEGFSLVEGRAEDVSLFLWGRRGPDVVKVDGDEDLARSMLDWMGS